MLTQLVAVAEMREYERRLTREAGTSRRRRELVPDGAGTRGTGALGTLRTTATSVFAQVTRRAAAHGRRPARTSPAGRASSAARGAAGAPCCAVC